ncbi:MAG: TlpA family protein disulfide reductase [Solirubrobacterales bacterium]
MAEPEGKRSVARRYSTVVGLVFVVVVAIAIINGVRTQESGILGAEETDAGTPLPEFAVPEALGPLEGDANIEQGGCNTDAVPCPPDEVQPSACDVDVADAIRVCDLFDKPLALSFWFTRGAECTPAQDDFNAVAERFGDEVNFLIVNVRDDREEVRELIAERGWSVPVGYDADGAVSNIYRVGVCPTVQLAYPGGTLMRALFGEDEVSAAALETSIEALIDESERREGNGAAGDRDQLEPGAADNAPEQP